MKTAEQWADEFLNEHVLNVRGSVFREFIEAVQRDASKPKWKNISSAPLTGKTILISDGANIESVYRDYDDWCVANSEPSYIKEPTHWTPLPEPPCPNP